MYSNAIQENLLLQRQVLDLPYIAQIDNETFAYMDWISDQEALKNFVIKYWPSNTSLSADGYLIQRSWLRDDTESTLSFRNYPYVPNVSIF